MKTKDYDKTIEDLKKAAEELEKTPMAIAFRAEKAAELLSKRQAAVDRIEALKLDFEACGVIQREIDGMIKNLQAVDIERARLQSAINEKAYFLSREKSGIEGEARQQTQILFETYDPEIDKAIEFFREKLDELRKPGRISYVKIGVEKNLFTDTKTIIQESNEAAVLAAMLYDQDAIKKIESMKLMPAFDPAEIEKMKREIPRIDVYTDIDAVEKPLEKGPDVGFLARARREVDDRIDRLLHRK